MDLTNSKNNENEYASSIINKYEIYLSLEGSLDKEKRSEKIKKEIENLSNYLTGLNKKLSNENFLNKASEEIINSEKIKQSETLEKLDKLKKLLV